MAIRMPKRIGRFFSGAPFNPHGKASVLYWIGLSTRKQKLYISRSEALIGRFG